MFIIVSCMLQISTLTVLAARIYQSHHWMVIVITMLWGVEANNLISPKFSATMRTCTDQWMPCIIWAAMVIMHWWFLHVMLLHIITSALVLLYYITTTMTRLRLHLHMTVGLDGTVGWCAMVKGANTVAVHNIKLLRDVNVGTCNGHHNAMPL